MAIRLPREQLSVINGLLYWIRGSDRVLLGRLPSGEVPGRDGGLTLTSKAVVIHGDSVWMTCSRCRAAFSLEAMGLRWIGKEGRFRNQPQCGPCRRAEAKGSSALRGAL